MRDPLSRGASSHLSGRPFSDDAARSRLRAPQADSMARTNRPTKDGGGRVSSDQPVEGTRRPRTPREGRAEGIPSPAMDGRQPDRRGIAGADPVGAGAVDPPRRARLGRIQHHHRPAAAAARDPAGAGHEPGRPALRKRRRRHANPAAPAQAGTAAGRARRSRAARLRLPRSRAPAGLGPRPAGVDQGERGRPRAAGAGAGRRREPPENGGRRGLDQHQRPRAEPGQPPRAEPDHDHRRRKDRDLHLRPAVAGADAGTLAEGAGLGAAVRLAGPVRPGGVPGDRLPAPGRPQLRDRHHRGRGDPRDRTHGLAATCWSRTSSSCRRTGRPRTPPGTSSPACSRTPPAR